MNVVTAAGPGKWIPMTTITSPSNTGWICPKCNRGVSPSLQYCGCSMSITTPGNPSAPFTPTMPLMNVPVSSTFIGDIDKIEKDDRRQY